MVKKSQNLVNIVCKQPLTKPLFVKKIKNSYILHNLLIEFGIWFWVVENLGSIHHVSVVRVLENNRQGNEKKKKVRKFSATMLFKYLIIQRMMENEINRKNENNLKYAFVILLHWQK